MPALPELVVKAWEDRQGPIILTTVGQDLPKPSSYFFWLLHTEKAV